MRSITIIGATFLLYLFIMIIVFYVLSSPVAYIFDAFAGVPLGEASDEMATYLPYYRAAVQLGFAIGIATPVVWFIMKIFSREPAYYMPRRY